MTKNLVFSAFSVEVDDLKTECVVMSEQNHNIKIGNKSFENVKQFRYFEATLKNKNYFHE